MRLIRVFLSLVILSGCSSLNKTMLYSSLAGTLAGGLLGHSLSPNKSSEQANAVVFGLVGGAASAGAAYFLYREARPDLKLKSSPLKEEVQLAPIQDTNLSVDALRVVPPLVPVTEKKVIEFSQNVPEEVRKSARKQYYIKHKTKPITIEDKSKTFEIPSFEVIESGVE